MKFMVTIKTKDSFGELPEETRAKLHAGSFDIIDKHIKAGKIKGYYLDMSSEEVVSIWDVESDEELCKLVFNSPIVPYTHIQVSSILEYEIGNALTRQVFWALTFN